MAGASTIVLLIVVSVAVTFAGYPSCLTTKKVHVLLEGTQTQVMKIIRLPEATKFFRSLTGDETGRSGKCWTRYIDYRYDRQGTVIELKRLAEADGDKLMPPDQAPVILLILYRYDIDLNDVEDAANDLLELGYKFITIGVGRGWKKGYFRNIALQSHRIILVDGIKELGGYSINERILSILRDPELDPGTSESEVLPQGSSGQPGEAGSPGLQGSSGQPGEPGFPGPEMPKCRNEAKWCDGYKSSCSSDPNVRSYCKKMCNLCTSAIRRPRISDSVTRNCAEPVDLGFVLDSSSSLKGNFEREKLFIKMMANAFNVKKGGTHAGVVSFSDKAELNIKLSQTSTYNNFRNDVNKIEYMNSVTRIDLALKLVQRQLFTKENGGRNDKKKVLVVLTDGFQTRREQNRFTDVVDPAIIADQLRSQKVEILVIGIGNEIKEEELKKLAGPKDNYRHANDFRELSSKEFAANMTTKICDIAIIKECKRIVDICFLLDSSGTINKYTDWETMKSFVRRLAHVFKLSETGARGSVVVFSDRIEQDKAYTKVTIKLNNGLSASDFGRKIEHTPYIGYRTRIDLGFNLIENEVFTLANGARRNIQKVIVLITDGRQTPKRYDPVAASKKLYDDGVSIFAIGIGKRIDFQQLNQITRKPGRVFRADSFSSLENAAFVNNVSDLACPPPEITCCCPKLDEKLKTSMGKKLVEVVKKEIGEYCEQNCEKPEIAPPRTTTRKRRSIDIDYGMDNGTHHFHGFEELGVLNKYTKMAGCNSFLNALRKYGILKNISDLMEENKQVSIFCPVDDAYGNFYTRQDFAGNERNILLNHIGFKDDKYGRIYRTLLPGGQILFNAVTKGSNKMLWKANDVEVISSFVDGTGSEIVVVNDIILPTKRNLLDVLKSNNVSIFYDLLVKTQLTDILKNTEIDKICFTQGMCLSVTSSMFNQLKAAVNLNQFTICAPTNNMLLNMKKSQLTLLMNDETARKEFLQEYVFLGSLGNPASKEVAYSLSTNHFVLTTKMVKNTMFLKHADGRKFEVKDTKVVTEGTVYVIEMTK